MAATPENSNVHDPLGLQTFALSESAYDLITSLIGVYTRLTDYAEKSFSFDQGQLAEWNKRIDELHALYYQTGWDGWETLPGFIATLTSEYKQIAHLETEFANATNTQPRAVLSY